MNTTLEAPADLDRARAPVIAHIERPDDREKVLCGKELGGEYVTDWREKCVVCEAMARAEGT
jgi:hypothetical protein